MSWKGHKQFSLIFATLKMALATFSSRILGLVREQVMAATFGASGITDAFTVAYRVPNMLRDLFAEGAFSSAFVPVFTKARLENEKASRILLWSMAILLGSMTLVIAGGVIYWAPFVVRIMTDDQFIADTERFEITVQMVRIMAPFLTLISLAALFMGALNSLKVFFVPALAPALFNIIMIASMIYLPPVVEAKGVHPIIALAIGVIGGGLAQMLLQVPLLFKKGFGPSGELELFGPYTKSILNRLGIGTVGVAATQINILITTILATGTQLGAVSWLTYAFRLFQFPVGILSVSIGGSNLVHFSEAWKAGKREEAKSTLATSYLFSWLLILPAFVLIMGLANETVHLIFERGAFSSRDTAQSAMALRQYMWGLPFYGLYKIFGPTFFSIDRPKIPVFISITAIAANIIFCLLMVPQYGFSILALGTSLSMMLNCFLQSVYLHKYLRLGAKFFISTRLVKFLISAGLSWLVLSWIRPLLYDFSAALLLRCVQYAICCLITVATYVAMLLVLGESKTVKAFLNKKK